MGCIGSKKGKKEFDMETIRTDTFLKIFDSIPVSSFIPDKIKVISIFLTSFPTLRKIFFEYLQRGDWLHYFELHSKQISYFTDKDSASNDPSVVTVFHFPVGAASIIHRYIFNKDNQSRENGEFDGLSEFEIKNHILHLLFPENSLYLVTYAAILPFFLESQPFCEWCLHFLKSEDLFGLLQVYSHNLSKIRKSTKSRRLSHSPKGVLPFSDASLTSIADTDGEGSDQLDTKINAPECFIEENVFLFSIKELNFSTFTKDLSSLSWLSIVSNAIENLPYCVSLGKKINGQEGSSHVFVTPPTPLVYVNRMFETITEFKRHDAVGQTCKFLQSEATEIEQVEKIALAMSQSKPIKVALTNTRKNGGQFFNLLALTPVNEYVLGIQFDIQQHGLTTTELHFVDEINSLLSKLFL